jgi:protein-S-isoprenylcysteine O-methyltransferase Ste14
MPMPQKKNGKKASVAVRAVRPLVVTLVFLPAMLFIPAGTVHFWQGWALIAVTFSAQVFTIVYFLRRDPQVLARRLIREEPRGAQKLVIFFLKVFFTVSLILAARDFKHGWTREQFGDGALPWWISVAALVVIVRADIWFIAVLIANRFAASVIQVESGQPIAASGPYRFMRHPIYTGGIVRWLATPLVLGSIVTVPAFCLIIPVLAARLLLEEQFLKRELPGYVEYCQKTRWRLVPWIW